MERPLFENGIYVTLNVDNPRLIIIIIEKPN